MVLNWLLKALPGDSEHAPQVFHHYGSLALSMKDSTHRGVIALGVAVTFAIVFRTQLAWNRPKTCLRRAFRGRYWEAVTQLHVMYSKWADAYSQFQGFAEVTLKAAKVGLRAL